MKNYDSLSADLFYTNKGMTGLESYMKETVLGVLKYDFDIDPVIAGLVKFFKSCFKKRIRFETEIHATIAGECTDRLFYFVADVGDLENGTIQVFQCDENGVFDRLEDRQVLSQACFIKNFKALTEDLKKNAQN